MPNWCSNEVSIIAENEEGTEELKQFIKDCFTEEEEGDEKPLLDFEKVIIQLFKNPNFALKIRIFENHRNQ